MSRYYPPEGVFYNLDKTLDSEFYCLKCFVLNHFRNQAQFFNLFGFFVILCSLNGLQTIATVETMNFQTLCFIRILQPPLGWQNLDRTIAYTRFHRIKGAVPPPSPTNNFDTVMKFKDFYEFCSLSHWEQDS